MSHISVELSHLADLGELSGSAAASVLAAAGWSGERRNPTKSWATTWRRGDVHAWIQGDGPVAVEFTLWFREVEEEARADLDAFMGGLYAAAEAELTEVVADLSSGDFGERLQATGDNVADVDDFIQYRAWRVAGRELVTGVRQSDTDTPVMIVVVLRESAVEAEEVEDDWL
ncbi:hypothetical protein KBY55_01675 [Streptomyces sp. b94]|uniref:hypothetical protein n=1 Tax=Streptomyces sp. b94 TaxID=1827634 RepID=UPI001B37A653|nr:hypothetical protein [Streptomyces sp. b94]MBQ1094844.1 hypothetical protein [Streptomyces sp. b94]